MLRNRVITALILAPLVIGAVYFLPHPLFAGLIALVLAVACHEWSGFCAWPGRVLPLAYAAGFLVAAFMAYQFPHMHLLFIQAGVALWLAAVLAVLLYPRGQQLYASPWLLAPLGWLMLLTAWLCVVQIHRLENGSHWTVWALLVVWAADVGAYFAGKSFGKRKLAPAVSPGKTWEGALGGLLLALLVCAGGVIAWQGQPLFWLLVTGLLVAVSVFGDLFESLLKRSTGMKDSGTILPGHGGLLDRIDSLLAVLPVLTLILLAREV
ncbi:MAG: phosphatidate cytidylyltransferase [Pseudomonadales bacterium]